MKKKNLKLEDLKVNSFVTVSSGHAMETIKGGLDGAQHYLKRSGVCDTALCMPTPATACREC